MIAEQLEPVEFPAALEPLVSVIVSVHDEPGATTYRCFRDLAARTRGPSFEVIAAIGGDAGADRPLDRLLTNARVVRGERERGFAGNCMAAVGLARGDLLVFLQSDVSVHHGWLQSLVDTLERNPDHGLAGPKILDEDGRVQEAGRIVWRDGSMSSHGSGEDPDDAGFNYLKPVDCVPAPCFAMRSAVWQQLGGFDEECAPGYEDADLAFGVRSLGYRAVYQPQAVVTHLGPARHTVGQPGHARLVTRARKTFRHKWENELATGQCERGRHLFSARDRSGGGPRILVVDRHIPEYDRDAGSRAVFHYLQLLVELGASVTFLPDDMRHRGRYAEDLQQMGVETVYADGGPAEFDEWLRRHGPYFDCVHVHRPEIASQRLPAIRRHAPFSRVVYFAHDLHHLRELRRFRVTGSTAALGQSVAMRPLENAVMEAVDVVYVFSDHERDLLQAELGDTPVRRIPLFITSPRPDDVPPYDSRRDVLFVGNFAHAPNRDAVHWFASAIAEPFRARVPDAGIFIVGARPTADITALSRDGIEVTGAVSEDDLRALYRRCRVVAAPLRYGAGVKGKIVEAFAEGVPVATTTVGLEGMPLAERCSAVADTAEDFAARLAELYTDRRLWQELSSRSLGYAAEHFSRAAAVSEISLDLQHRPRSALAAV